MDQRHLRPPQSGTGSKVIITRDTGGRLAVPPRPFHFPFPFTPSPDYPLATISYHFSLSFSVRHSLFVCLCRSARASVLSFGLEVYSNHTIASSLLAKSYNSFRSFYQTHAILPLQKKKKSIFPFVETARFPFLIHINPTQFLQRLKITFRSLCIPVGFHLPKFPPFNFFE